MAAMAAMAARLRFRRAWLFAAFLCLAAAASGCRRGSGDDLSGLAGIYGTWVASDGYTVVLLADTDPAAQGGRLIGMIPGTASGRVLIREAGEGGKWRAGIYKLVKDRILTRSSDEETWAVSFTCDLRSGRLFMPGGDGKPVELLRSARTAPVRFEEGAPGK